MKDFKNCFLGLMLFALGLWALQKARAADSQAEAWPEGTEAWVNQTYTVPFPDPYAASLWSSIQAKSYILDPSKRFSPVRRGSVVVDVPNSHFENQSLPVYLFLREQANASPHKVKDGHATLDAVVSADLEKAPLLVFLPGSFNNPADTQCQRAMDLFARRGFHVLVIPNALGDEYIAQKPKDLPGSISAEAQIVLEIIESIKKTVGPEHISEVHLFGVSYGGLLASAAATLDRRQNLNLITSPVTIVSPSFKLRDSMQALDKVIGPAIPESDEIHSKFTLNGIVFHYLGVTKQNELPATGYSSVKEAPNVIALLGFLDWLIAAAKALHKNGNGPEPGPNFTFASFKTDYYPASFWKNYSDTEDLLPYWVSEAAKLKVTVRILASRDDIINPDSKLWDSNPYNAFNASNLILLEHGGHMGYYGDPWFEFFLDRVLAKPQVLQPVFDTQAFLRPKQSGDMEMQFAEGIAETVGSFVIWPSVPLSEASRREIASLKCPSLMTVFLSAASRNSTYRKMGRQAFKVVRVLGSYIVVADPGGHIYAWNAGDGGTTGVSPLLSLARGYLSEDAHLEAVQNARQN